MIPRHTIAALLALGTLTLAGCPELSPPFDATGNYAGAFAVGVGDLELIDGCGMILTLEQDVQGLPLLNGKVEGTVTLTFDCLLPEDLALLASGGAGDFGAILVGLGVGAGLTETEGLPDMGGLGTLLGIPAVEVSGVLLPDGTLELNTPGMMDDCTEGDCVKLAILGKGIDSNADGRMDWFDGTFGGTLGSSLGGMPIIGDFETSTLE
jgi:hypothetical protein